MKLKNNYLISGIILFLILINVFLILDLQLFYIRAVLAFIFIITVPGLLIMLMFKIREVGFWEYLVYTVGLSISFIMFAGLIVNWTLPALQITDKPLSLYPILICFDIFLLVFSYIAWKRNSDLEYNLKALKLNWFNRIFFIIPVIFPVLAVLGAFTLNNFGPNTLTMIMLGSIAVYVFLLVLFRDRLNENIYPWALFWIGLSLLLMFSMRGSYVNGTDIIKEFKIYSFSKNTQVWNFSSYFDEYNSCLSLNIFPVVVNIFSNIEGHMLFKLLYPLIFSFSSIIVFLICKKFALGIISLLASFFFISQMTFFLEMTMESRQSIAIIFFGLFLMVLFNKNINGFYKRILMISFGFSMIVSHYSTSYFAIFLFLVTFLICLIYRLFKSNNKNKKNSLFLSGGIILILLLFSFLWFNQITPTSNGLVNIFQKTFLNLNNILGSEFKEQGLSITSQLNPFSKPPVYPNYLTEYSSKIIKNSSIKNYPKNLMIYPTFPKISKTNYGINNEKISYISLIGETNKKFLRFCIILGIFLIFYKFTKNEEFNIEYLILCSISAILIIAMIVLPIVSTQYSVGRLGQQILVILSLPCILFLYEIRKLLKIKEWILGLIIAFLLIFFLYNSWFIYGLIGGTSPNFNIDYFGETYDRFYNHYSEKTSSIWLKDNRNPSIILNADDFAKKKIELFGEYKNYIQDVHPYSIQKSNYVYLDYKNTIYGIVYKQYQIKKDGAKYQLYYKLPEDFLNQYKNKIYNNQGSEIFK